jgi:predicted ATPase/class 3 adenylate cyclase
MQQIADWLKGLGMSEYAQRFAENGIDVAALPHLTDQDLKDIGVLLGHRRIMLAAIGELASAAAATSKRAPTVEPKPQGSAERRRQAQTLTATTPTPVSAALEGGERRHVTVMFCDLVDSTGIAAQLDAEDWRDLVGAYLDAASAAVTEMGGHVAKKLGDGLMALFGHPVAQENDSERAVRAALSIQRALAELNRKNEGTGKRVLVARIAIESGPVVVDASGEIYGDVPNIAARAQALAEPGAVVTTARVQRQIAGLFVAEERGSYELKGVPEAVKLFRIMRASGGGRRAGQRHLTPLVGRDEEIAMLMRRWDRARQGEGQLVIIVGEPGLGKSRLIEEFHARLRERPHTWVEWSCIQLLQNTPLHPIAEWGNQRFGGPDVPAEQRLADLENSLAQVKLDPAKNVPLVASLLDITLPSERVSTLAPEELRRQQLAALTNWIMAGARSQAVVLALEDVHWADPTTLDLLRGIAERGALAPLFVLISARPEFRAPWGMRSHHSTISLAPLDRQQVRDMVAELSARHALPKEVIDGVTERVGGVPLFVEEVTRLLLERGVQGGIQAIPPTLQQSLTARLDRLGPAREVAQIGSVIGRDFSYALLHSVAGMEEAPLRTARERLTETDILLVQGLPPESNYRFKHALIQDAAYATLLRDKRRQLHTRIAEALELLSPEAVEARPELIAQHCAEAGLVEKAVHYRLKAGQAAIQRSATAEALAQLNMGLELLASLPDCAARDRLEIELQVALGVALMAAKGWSAPETARANARARALCERLGETARLFPVLYGQWVFHAVRAELAEAQEVGNEMLRRAEEQGEMAARVVGHRLLGTGHVLRGALDQARAHFERGLALYDPQLHRDLAFLYAQDPRAAGLSGLSWALLALGYPEQARARSREALESARELAHLNTQAYALLYASVFSQLGRDRSATQETGDALATLAGEQGFPHFVAATKVIHGWVLAETDNAEAGLAQIREGLAAWKATGAGFCVPYFLGLQAQAHARAGQVEEGLDRLIEALTLADRTGERVLEAELHRLRSELLQMVHGCDPARVEASFRCAMTVAHSQGARLWELRAAMSMARLWHDQGKPQQARALLAPIYGWFTEGFDTRDLKEAQVLLNALA